MVMTGLHDRLQSETELRRLNFLGIAWTDGGQLVGKLQTGLEEADTPILLDPRSLFRRQADPQL